MDFLEHDCDNIPNCKKSHRMRSWYLYEQFKSLEHNQLDAARKLKDRSYQDRILRQELSERKARRILYDQVGLGQSDSGIERVRSESTRDSLSTDDFFESFHELQEDEDLDQMAGPDLLGACSQGSPNEKFYEDDFKSVDEPTKDDSAESVVSVVNVISSATVTDNLKNYFDFKKAKLEDLDLTLDDVTEKLECFERLAKLGKFDNFSENEDSLDSTEKETKHTQMTDKNVDTLDNNVNIMWTKLVTFAYQIMESNQGNFYYDYGSQLMTAVLACDVLRRGINRMCHILQPYVSPIKFAAESESSFESYKKFKWKKPRRSKKNTTRHYKCHLRNNSIPKTRMKSFVTKRYRPDKWERQSLPFFAVKQNYIKDYQTSEPWQSTPKLSINRINPRTRSSYHRHWPLFLCDNNIKKDLCKLACKCDCHKVVNPMLRLSLYLDRIMRDIDDPISY